MNKKQIERLKTTNDLFCKRIKELEERLDAVANYNTDLIFKINIALDRLSIISTGRFFESEKIDGDQAAYTAALGLKKIARMQERKP